MICQKCHKNTATTTITTTVNNITSQMNLCPECLSVYGHSKFGSFAFNDLFSEFFNQTNREKYKSCSTCNKTFDEIIKEGKVGCPDCYANFKEEFKPLLSKIHGTNKHNFFVENDSNEIEKLKQDLKKLIENEEYEQAAVIRDLIKEKQDNRNE